MNEELLKQRPSIENILDRMSRTFEDRRMKIAGGMPVTQVLLHDYPALTRAEMVCLLSNVFNVLQNYSLKVAA